jgi:predicted protein tyrosine phosphatase
MNNRMWNLKNPHQGDYKRVLCVCTAGLLRSPTAAVVLCQEPFNFNTRTVGSTTDCALVPVDDALLNWADELVFMERRHYNAVKNTGVDLSGKVSYVLNIPDVYEYRNPELMDMIRLRYTALSEKLKNAVAFDDDNAMALEYKVFDIKESVFQAGG